ncbi:peptidase [Brevundimonas sp. LM2]|uniref:peptidase n=1 Tax=Brevundimonas sp. LM2 TaxID=1938605 RepID=UPI000983ABA4|nr:peptidase [Brevundimonas sp. LM2]AQR61608.1 peptidase [Brevundimonas sp. LM2]
MRCSSLAVTVSAIALLSVGPVMAQEATPIRIGASVSGALTAEDARVDSEDEGQFVHDDYVVQLREGQRVEAVMRSDVFDAYLSVSGPTEDTRDLASDDDGLGEGTHARLRFAAPTNGAYRLRARTLSGFEGGDYSLQVSERAAAPRAPRPTGLRIGTAVEGRIADTDPVNDDDHLYDAYTFRASEGQRYAVSLDSDDFDSVVRIGTGRGDFDEIASNDDSGAGGLNAYLIFTAPRSGEFIVRAAPLDGATTGAYTLTVAEAGPAAPRTPIALGDTVEGTLGGDKNDLGAPAEVYTFSALAGQRIVATLRSDAFDAYLELFAEKAVHDGGRVSVDMDDDGAGEGTDARLTYSVTEAGDYSLEARAFGEDGSGPFTLSLEAAAPEPAAAALAMGATVQGEIVEGDAVDDESRGYDAYRFTGIAGNRVQVIMRSGDFDTYLQVGSAEGEFSAQASDDDGLGEGTDSRLNHILPADGDYIVRASPLSSDTTGLYSLELIDRGPQPLPGSILVGATARGTLSEDDALTEDGANYDAYKVTVKAEEKLTLTMVSNAFDAYLDVGTEDDGVFTSVVADDDSLSDTHAKIDWTVEEDGDYVIRARSFASGQEGAYALTVEQGE